MGRPKKYPVQLTDNERDQLTDILRKGTHSAIMRRRANILLHLDQNHGDVLPVKEIANRCHVTTPTIYKLSRDFSQKGLSKELLQSKPRKSTPQDITGEVEALVIATACSQPPEGYARWTVRLLANKIILEDGSKLSKSSVGLILKKHR